MRENLTSGSTGGRWKRGNPAGHPRVPGRCAEKRHHHGLVGTQPAGHLQPRQRSTLLLASSTPYNRSSESPSSVSRIRRSGGYGSRRATRRSPTGVQSRIGSSSRRTRISGAGSFASVHTSVEGWT